MRNLSLYVKYLDLHFREVTLNTYINVNDTFSYHMVYQYHELAKCTDTTEHEQILNALAKRSVDPADLV
jgi:hypothetical protein